MEAFLGIPSIEVWGRHLTRTQSDALRRLAEDVFINEEPGSLPQVARYRDVEDVAIEATVRYLYVLIEYEEDSDLMYDVSYGLSRMFVEGEQDSLAYTVKLRSIRSMLLKKVKEYKQSLVVNADK